MAQRNTLSALDERQRYTIEESIGYLRGSRSSVYAKIKAGELRVIKDGRRSYIPGTELIRCSTLGAK